MSTNLMTTATTVAEKKPFTREQIHLIKTQIARECNDDELALFVGICERTGLDPFARQIYAIKRSDRNAPGGKRMIIQTGIDGYRLIADRTGNYAGNSDPVFQHDQDGRVVKATASVTKMVQGACCSFTASALMAEYKPASPGPLWDRMPHVMLAKCAEAAALRKAFPADLSGLFTHEEMAQADHPVEEIKRVEEAKRVEELPHTQNETIPPAVVDEDFQDLLMDAEQARPGTVERMLKFYRIHSVNQLTEEQMVAAAVRLRAAIDQGMGVVS